MDKEEIENKDLYHIDSCIFVELYLPDKKNKEKKKKCENFLSRCGWKFNGEISMLILGEIIMIILKKTKKDEKQIENIKELRDLLVLRKISFASVKEEIAELFKKIKECGIRENIDALHLAIAKVNGARYFVTMDKKDIINNQKLKNEFGIIPRDVMEL